LTVRRTGREERVVVTREGDIAIATLSRPDRHNGVDADMLAGMHEAQRCVRAMRDLRAVILRGDGPSFCAGLDFKAVLGDRATAARLYAQLWSPVRNRFQTWSLGWRALGIPVIAAIHGNCLGAGLQLALGADVRIATPEARLSVLEAKWGLIPDMGGAALMRHLLPIDVATELTMTGRVLSGAEAHALRLVTRVADDPLAAARALAAEIATRSPDSVAASKLLLQQAYDTDEAGALRTERRWQRRLLGFENFRISLRRNRGEPEAPFVRRRLGR
jgi:enoyl-CoA hydratase/carnithine racemase